MIYPFITYHLAVSDKSDVILKLKSNTFTWTKSDLTKQEFFEHSYMGDNSSDCPYLPPLPKNWGQEKLVKPEDIVDDFI